MAPDELKKQLQLGNDEYAQELLDKLVEGEIGPVEYARRIRDLCPDYDIAF